jgi:hypothetical protein
VPCSGRGWVGLGGARVGMCADPRVQNRLLFPSHVGREILWILFHFTYTFIMLFTQMKIGNVIVLFVSNYKSHLCTLREYCLASQLVLFTL